MTSDELKVSIKGTIKDIIGMREKYRRESLQEYVLALLNVAFEKLNKKIKNSPFKDVYEITITDKDINADALSSLTDIAVYERESLKEYMNSIVSEVDDIAEIIVDAIPVCMSFNLSIRVKFKTK